MSTTQQMPTTTSQPAAEINLTTPSDRRVDVERKHGKVAEMLRELSCDGMLIADPANFSWVTSGGVARGIINDDEAPAVYFSPDARWLICSNVDTQRLFDEEIDALGFQLKEWPWHWGRDHLLADLCQGR